MGRQRHEARNLEGVACVNCAYDLVGLDASAKCPECGLPVEQSLREPLLRNEPAEWLERCVRGVRLWHRGGWVGVLLVVALVLVMVAVEFGLKNAGIDRTRAVWVIVENGLLLAVLVGAGVCGLMYLFGLWLVTSPKADERSVLGWVRAPARWLAVAFPLAVGLRLFELLEWRIDLWLAMTMIVVADAAIIAHLWTSARVAKRLGAYVEHLPDNIRKRIRYSGRDAVLVAVITALVVPWRYGEGDPILFLTFLFIVSYVGVLGSLRKLVEMERTIAVERERGAGTAEDGVDAS